MNVKQAIEWARFSYAMKPVVQGLIKDLFHLTSGDVQLSTRAVHRIRDRGYELDEARRDVDARLEAVATRGPKAP